MELQKAINQLSEIHAQVSKTEFYRGFKAVPVAITGLGAFLAALLQPWIIGNSNPVAFVWYWQTIALINIVFIGYFIGYSYFYHETRLERQKARNMLRQFLPCVVTGALITWAFLRLDEPAILYYLPGIWSALFGLGTFSCRPYFPASTFWVGLYYLFAGAVLLIGMPTELTLQPWVMGLTFGIGQLSVAAVLYWDLERQHG